jgi:glycosyltransferase involved in cell wall biosynthesis
MSRILLVQPDAGGHLSGGYLYNAEMAAHGAWDLLSVAFPDLETALAPLDHDLVIADSIWLTEASFAPFVRLGARGVRVAVMMHSFPSMIAAAERGQGVRERPTSLEIDLLQRAGLVLTPGPHYASLLDAAETQVLVIEPGIEDTWRVAPRPRGGRCSLVSVGAVTPRKGFRDALEALQRRREDDWRWTVVGSLDAHPVYARALVERAETLEHVHIAGQRPPDEVRAIVTGADVLLMPSYDENQPLVVLEAMAASVPPIAYAAGAIASMVTHGSEGLVGPIGDVAELARNLSRLIDDEGERHRMARACWQRQRAIPSWATAAGHARVALEAILSGAK